MLRGQNADARASAPFSHERGERNTVGEDRLFRTKHPPPHSLLDLHGPLSKTNRASLPRDRGEAAGFPLRVVTCRSDGWASEEDSACTVLYIHVSDVRRLGNPMWV
jgi:hypothetical protein